MEEITALCKRRGFIFQSSELYGGVNGAWDYGPIGVELKRNVRDAWWRDIVALRDDVVGLDSVILMAPAVWRASGHVENFTTKWWIVRPARSVGGPTISRATAA